jgi:hypothetical protein
MAATTIGLDFAEGGFGVVKENQFICLKAEISRGDSKSEFQTYEGGHVCVIHGANLILKIDGVSGINGFKELFQTDYFATSQDNDNYPNSPVSRYGYTMFNNGDSSSGFLNFFDMLYPKDLFYIKFLTGSGEIVNWIATASEEEIRIIFVNLGHPNAQVERDTTNKNLSWIITGLENYNFRQIPRQLPISVIPIITIVEFGINSLIITGIKIPFFATIFSLEERITSDGFTEFSVTSKAYPTQLPPCRNNAIFPEAKVRPPDPDPYFYNVLDSPYI